MAVTFLAPGAQDREYAQSMPRNHVSPVLVGRDAELAALMAAFDSAAAAEPSVVLVGGEAGVGKTRLVEEAALAGMPGIVLDFNNDLARLGEPWPEPPAAFTDEDATKAQA